MRSMGVPGSPSSSPPRVATMSPVATGWLSRVVTALPRASLAGRGRRRVERLDHLVGDVHARAREHGLLDDEVVLLAVEDLPHGAVGALDHRCELLVLALVQVFLELPAPALEVAVLLDQLALAAGALALGQR